MDGDAVKLGVGVAYRINWGVGVWDGVSPGVGDGVQAAPVPNTNKTHIQLLTRAPRSLICLKNKGKLIPGALVGAPKKPGKTMQRLYQTEGQKMALVRPIVAPKLIWFRKAINLSSNSACATLNFEDFNEGIQKKRHYLTDPISGAGDQPG
jgi:hypothetical protein